MFWARLARPPFLVGGALMAAAMLLEALQALTPDRCCDFQAALYGVGGALMATLVAQTLVWLRGRACLIMRF